MKRENQQEREDLLQTIRENDEALEERDDLISDLQGQKSDLETKLLQLQESAKLLACERAQVDEALEVAGVLSKNS